MPEDKIWGATMLAKEAKINFFPAGYTESELTDENAVLKIGQNAGIMTVGPNDKPGMSMKDPTDDSFTEISSEGLWSNGGNMQFLSLTTGIQSNATIAAELNHRNSSSDGLSAAIFAMDNTTSADGASKSYGAIMSSMWCMGPALIGSLLFNMKSKTADYTCTDQDTVVMCYNTSADGLINITMPTVPDGSSTDFRGARLMIIRRVNSGAVKLLPDGSHQFAPQSGLASSVNLTGGAFAILLWDGSYWHISQI
jgi:hypothetical protein